MWLVHELGGSTFYTGIAGFLFFAPRALQFSTGPFVDTWDLRRTLYVSQLIQGVAILWIPAAYYLDVLTIWQVLLVIPTLSMLNQFTYPAQNASLPLLVEDENLADANSLFSLAYTGTDAVFNAVGGVVVAVVGAISAFVINSATFFVAASLFWTVSIQRTESNDVEPLDDVATYLSNIAEGYRYITNTVFIRLIKAGVVINLVGGITLAILPAFADAQGGPELYGAFLASFAVGSLIGAVLAPRLAFLGAGKLLVAFFSFGFVTWYGFLVVDQVAVSVVLFGLAWIPTGLFNVVAHTLLQTTAPEDMLGRATSVYSSALAVSVPIGSLTGGLSGSLLTPESTLWIFGVGFVVPVAYFLYHGTLIELGPIDAIDDDDVYI